MYLFSGATPDYFQALMYQLDKSTVSRQQTISVHDKRGGEGVMTLPCLEIRFIPPDMTHEMIGITT
jgi:hypothetical protein